MDQSLDQTFFYRRPEVVARALIGVRLMIDGVGGMIVETEAYDAADPASHSFRGPTARNAAMFGLPGRAYVYRIYGLHWCLNFVCSAPGETGGAVLVRALEPEAGVEAMMARRGMADRRRLCAGPGRLCQALGVTGELDGAALDARPFALTPPTLGGTEVAVGTRIGITKGAETAWRFGAARSPFLSAPFRDPV
ncbi:MAG TPA: DNA-3-methyladenine glycosylase [Brevundimonas sp.]|nr:DNA-3-methyladenine glycosylase [Brevundimonas sp.]